MTGEGHTPIGAQEYSPTSHLTSLFLSLPILLMAGGAVFLLQPTQKDHHRGAATPSPAAHPPQPPSPPCRCWLTFLLPLATFPWSTCSTLCHPSSQDPSPLHRQWRWAGWGDIAGWAGQVHHTPKAWPAAVCPLQAHPGEVQILVAVVHYKTKLVRPRTVGGAA